MCPSAIPEPADSGTMGYYGVLWRVHEPLLASLFWLALGSVLGWPDAVGGPMPAPEDACARVRQKPCRSRAEQEATTPAPLTRYTPRQNACGSQEARAVRAAWHSAPRETHKRRLPHGRRERRHVRGGATVTGVGIHIGWGKPCREGPRTSGSATG